MAALRIGLVGAGGIATAHLPNLLRLSADVSVFSLEGADELVARFGGTVVPTLDALLERVDLVDVTTPTNTHPEVVLRALAAGKDVICEKPLARTDAAAAALVGAASAACRRLYPAHVVRYFGAYVRLQSAVTQGRLGNLAVLRFARSGSYPTRAWFADPDSSGGVVLDQMIHDLDIARWVAGEVVTVRAVRAGSDDPENPIEGAHVLLNHASGAITQVTGVWGPPGLPFSTQFSVSGTNGNLTHDSRTEPAYLLQTSTPEPTDGFLPPTDPQDDPYLTELAEFAWAIQGGPEPRVSATDGLIAVRLANAALESIASGQPVEITTKEAGS